MNRFSRIDVWLAMERTGLVPLFHHDDVEIVKKVAKACYDGGARLLEFTLRGLYCQPIFEELSKYCEKECPEMILGVGSVADAATASQCMNIGANFVVTPVFREDIALICNRRKVMWSPGCASLTEITKAEELGCDIVKLFPGEVYGPKFIKAAKAPQPWTRIMPTGGVDMSEDNLKAWFDAGATCVGMGSKLISKELVAKEDYQTLQENVKKVLALIQKVR